MTVYCEKFGMELMDSAAVEGAFYLGETMRLLPEILQKYAEKIKLLYLNPPFLQKRPLSTAFPVGEKGYRGQTNSFAEIPLCQDCFKDEFECLAVLKQLLENSRALLCENGILCLHVNQQFSARARILLDEIFGEACFINEIIWHYPFGESDKTTFLKRHDTLFLYGKRPGTAVQPAGERCLKEVEKQADGESAASFLKTSGGKNDYAADCDDVWSSPFLPHKENGCSAQMPPELLDRLVCSCSKPGDIVCDLFAGGGAVLLSAYRNGRAYIGVEREPFYLLAFRQRMVQAGQARFTVYFAQTLQEGASVAIHRQESVQQVKITLDGYRILNVHASLPKYSDGLQYLSYWAAGRLEDDCFIPEAYSVRTEQMPKLKKSLVVPAGGKKAVYFCDCIGNQRFIQIE